MKSFPNCEETKTDAKIVLQENRSKITFVNPNQDKILVITVDDCAIRDDETLRCDYALVPFEEIEIYVELKGSDISHAVKQLESTICLISDNAQKTKKFCFIVSTRFPRQGPKTQDLQVRFKNKFNASFRVKNIQDEYDLSTCIA